MDDAASKPGCLLHVCCAPCATHSIQALGQSHAVTAFFYNPNIQPAGEYRLRTREMRDLGDWWGLPVHEGAYDVEAWFQATRGLEAAPEGGARCLICYRIRLETTARQAVALGIPAFTTTLTISPHKRADAIFPIGREVAEAHGLRFIEMDFKKKDGFKESCRLSREEGLYRQDYCGCVYSRREAEVRRP